jgi:hypothetical protein
MDMRIRINIPATITEHRGDMVRLDPTASEVDGMRFSPNANATWIAAATVESALGTSKLGTPCFLSYRRLSPSRAAWVAHKDDTGDCPVCEGRGEYPHPLCTCEECGGSGTRGSR